MTFIFWALIILLGIFLVVKKVQNGNQNQNLPPGPWGLPLFGHLIALGLSPHLKLIKWKKKYGPIIGCRFGSFPTIFLCDSKMVREAFNMVEFSGRPQFQVFVEGNSTKGIAFSDGSYNSELRHFLIRKLKEFGIGRKPLNDQIQEGISDFMDFINMRKGLPIKSEDVPSAHIIRAFWAIMMTDEMNPEQAEYMNHLVKRITTLGPVLSELAGFMPWMEKITRTISFGRYSLISTRKKQLHELYSFLRKLLQEKKRNQVKGQAPTDIMGIFLDKIEETTDKSSPFHSSQNSAQFFLGDLFGAGIHTTHTTLLWMFNYAARNPDVQLKLQEEIDEVIGNSRLPSLSDQGQMPYADGFVHEVLRMSSTVPLSVPHKTTADVRFHGYNIKKDTMIFANTYGIHHDPEIWGDPENFRPQRWFGESGKKLKNEHFFPFSMGRRGCAGDALAREQLFLYSTTLFQKYSVDFHMGKVPEVKGLIGIFLEPSPFTIVFKKKL